MLKQKFQLIQEPVELIYFDGTEECAKEIVELIGGSCNYSSRSGIIVINPNDTDYHGDRILPGDYIKCNIYNTIDNKEEHYYNVVSNIDKYKLVE